MAGLAYIPKRYIIVRDTTFARVEREIIAFSSVVHTYVHINYP